MGKINFTKMVASGNDFVVIESGHQSPVTSHQSLAKKICDRKFGVGADGLLVLGKSKVAAISAIRMRIFNPDGSEAEMCGNGARCIALWAKSKIPTCLAGRKNLPQKRDPAKCGKKSKILNIETKAGIIEAEVNKDNIKIKLPDPRDIKLDIPIKINARQLKVNFINTGVPHTIIFVEGLEKIDVVNLGSQIRYHKRFAPRGTNVDFVEVLNDRSIKIRTYERGVEDETLACGTGAVASSLISNIKYQISRMKENCRVDVRTKSGEILKVYFKHRDDKFKNVWLEGKARIVYEGVYDVK